MIIKTEKERGSKVTFERLKTANLGDEVYVVVTTENIHNHTVWLNVKQGKTNTPDLEYEKKGIMLQHDKGETTKAQAKVGAYAHDNTITNKDDFVDWAIFNFILGVMKQKKSYLRKRND